LEFRIAATKKKYREKINTTYHQLEFTGMHFAFDDTQQYLVNRSTTCMTAGSSRHKAETRRAGLPKGD
jgi:hypothetical protein